jgi:hypothetical protein
LESVALGAREWRSWPRFDHPWEARADLISGFIRQSLWALGYIGFRTHAKYIVVWCHWRGGTALSRVEDNRRDSHLAEAAGPYLRMIYLALTNYYGEPLLEELR